MSLTTTMRSISKYVALLSFYLVCTISYAQHDVHHQSTSEADSLYNEALNFLESLKQDPPIQSSSRTAGEENYQMIDTVFIYEFAAVNDSVLVRKRSPEYDDNLNYSSYTHFIKDDTWRPSSKVSYKRNEYGRFDFYLYQNWDTTSNDLRNDLISYFYYNENGQDTLIIRSSWDTQTDKWNYSGKVKSTYNNASQKVSNTDFNYDLNLQQWIPQYGYEIIYKNTLLKEIHYFTNNGAGELEPSRYYTYSYDAHNNIISDSTFNYNPSSQAYDFYWCKGSKLEYENDLVKVQYDSSVHHNGTVSNKHKIYYSYHSNNKILSKIDTVFRWDAELSIYRWDLGSHVEYDEVGRRTNAIYNEHAKYIRQYTEAGVLKLSEYYSWDKNLKYWIGQLKIENKFSSDDKKLSQKIYRAWAGNETDWSHPQYIDYYNYKSVGINRKEIAVCGDLTIPRDTIYQTNDSLKLVIYQTQDVVSSPEITLNGDILIAPEYSGAVYKWIDCNTGSVFSTDNNKYYFTTSGSYKVEAELYNCTIVSACIDATVTSTASERLQEVMIYPNPFTDRLRFDNRTDKYNELLVINPEGKVIYSAPLDPGNGAVDLSFLKNGMYIIKLTGNENTYSKKIIKE